MGAVRQSAHLAVMVGAYFLSNALAGPLAPLAEARLKFSPPTIKVGLSAALFCGLVLAGDLAVRRALAGRAAGRADRVGGFVLGTGNGAAIVYMSLCALLIFEKAHAGALGRMTAAFNRSAAVASARSHNYFARTAPAAARR